jgi:hypothetical protein
MQGDIPQSSVSIAEGLVIQQDFAERKGKFERHILRKKKNQKRIFQRSPNELLMYSTYYQSRKPRTKVPPYMIPEIT